MCRKLCRTGENGATVARMADAGHPAWDVVNRIRANHLQSDWRALGIGDIPVDCCSICCDEGWPCDATIAADELETLRARASS